MVRFVFLFTVLIPGFFACQSATKHDDAAEAEAVLSLQTAEILQNPDRETDPEKVTRLKEALTTLGGETYIQDLGKQIFNDSLGVVDEVAAKKYLDACEAYAIVNKGSESAADYLYKASETVRAMHAPERCIQIYDRIMKDYPHSKRASQSLFLKGFTYDNDLKDYTRAKVCYEEFLQKYPEDEFAGSATFLLENLGKSDDELLEVLQHKSQEQHADVQ